jgi:hypothetical protein
MKRGKIMTFYIILHWDSTEIVKIANDENGIPMKFGFTRDAARYAINNIMLNYKIVEIIT